MPMFQKKPVVVEAHQFDGSSSAVAEFKHWMNGGEMRLGQVRTRDLRPLYINTLEGEMMAQPGDWVIKGIQGEFYPCKPDIFEATYQAVS